MSDHLSTQELINRIESKDRRFRLAQSLFLILLISLLAGVIFVQFRTLDTVRQQLVVSKATAAETNKQNEQTQDKIVRRLDCMTAFFSQPNRQNLTIKDVEKCSLEHSDPNDFFAPANNTSTTTNGDGTETTTTQTTPGNPGATTPPPLTNTPPATQTPSAPLPETPPVEVLGVPVCVPFTGLCLR